MTQTFNLTKHRQRLLALPRWPMRPMKQFKVKDKPTLFEKTLFGRWVKV